MKTLEINCRVLILGTGFAGSILACIARRLGHSVVMVERSRHPRFAIGESTTPLTNLLMERLAVEYDLPFLGTLSKWGKWKTHHPDLRVGLKRGFSFFHHQPGMKWASTERENRELLVAASPHDAIADTHWYRPDLDAWLAGKAQEAGSLLLQGCRFQSIQTDSNDWIEAIRVTSDEGDFAIRPFIVLDATGPRGALHELLNLGREPWISMPATETLFNHFTGVKGWEESMDLDYSNAPYPPDKAAVHHLFPGGWCWILSFDDGVSSCGVVAEKSVSSHWALSRKDLGWRSFLDAHPTIKPLFDRAKPIENWRHTDPLPWRCGRLCGPNWALLPSAYGFVDPLLSTGFPLTLLGVRRLGEILSGEPFHKQNKAVAWGAYEAWTKSELAWVEKLVSALYANLGRFEVFKKLALFYFTAVSYSETLYRLNRQDEIGGFLLSSHPTFTERAGPLLDQAMADGRGIPDIRQTSNWMNLLDDLLVPFDVGGFTRPDRRHHFPVSEWDLYEAASKLGTDRGTLESMLVSAGFFQK